MNHDEIWTVLGLAPGSGEEAVRQAYLKALPNHHPEEDPAGFRNLREAYEAALAHAREGDGEPSEAEEKFRELMGGGGDSAARTLADRAVCELKAILDDFQRRLDAQAWKSVLERDEYGSLDMITAIGDKLLVVLMDDYYIPQRVWKLLDETFEWTMQEARLKEKFPPDYLEYIYNGIRYEKMIRDEYFDMGDPDADFQGFIERYYAVDNALNEGDAEKADELLKESAGPLFAHPDFRLLSVRRHTMAEAYDLAETEARELFGAWPEDPRVRYAYAHALVLRGKPAEALPLFRAVLEKFPSHYNARVGVVRSLFDMEDYEAAKAAALDLLVEYYFDHYVSGLFHIASEKLIPVYKEQLEADPSDQDVRYKLASCLFNDGSYEEAVALIEGNVPDAAHRAKHCELLFDGLLVLDDEGFDKNRAVELLDEWQRTETERARLRFVPQKYWSIDMEEEALEKAELYLREFPGDSEILAVVANIRRNRGETAQAYKAVREGLAANDGHPGLLSVQASLFESDGNISEAVGSAEAVLETLPYDTEMREMLMRLYFQAHGNERVAELAREAEALDCVTPRTRLYGAAAAIALDSEAEAMQNAEKALLEVLESEPDNRLALETLGDYYTNKSRPKESFEMFRRLIGIDDKNPYYYLSRGWLYMKFPEAFGEFTTARARGDFMQAIALEPGYSPAHYQLGYMAFHEARMEEAVGHFERTLETTPDFRGAHYYLAIAYSELGEADKAAGICDDGIGIFRGFAEEGDGEKEEYADMIQALQYRKFSAFLYNHRFPEALAVREALPGENAEDEDAADRWSDFAYCSFQVGDDEAAALYFERALRIAPQDYDILHAYGDFLYHAKKDYAGAISAYRRALRAENTFHMNVVLAKAFAMAGRDADARKQFKTALRVGKKGGGAVPGTPCHHYYLGECWFGLGNYKKAEAQLLKAVEKAGEYSDCVKRACYDADFLLAMLYRARGDSARAREYYELAASLVPDREYAEAAPLFEEVGSDA